MAEVNDTTLKEYFEVGDIPTQSNFEDLIESKINVDTLDTDINLASNSDDKLATQKATKTYSTNQALLYSIVFG